MHIALTVFMVMAVLAQEPVILGIAVTGAFLYYLFQQKEEKRPASPYRDPDPESVVRFRTELAERETRERWTATKYNLGQVGLGVLVALVFAGGMVLGHAWARRENDESRMLASYDSQEPARAPRDAPSRCLCREAALIILDFDVEPLGSPPEPWPHLILVRAIRLDATLEVCE